MSTWQEKVDLIRDIGKELGLEDADAARHQGDTCIDLKWTENGLGMFLSIPGEYISQDPLTLKKYIEHLLANGKAEKASR